MAINKKNDLTTPVNRSALGLTVTSANQDKYPIVYSEDVWTIVDSGSSISQLLSGATGTYTDKELLNELARNANASNYEMENITGGENGNIIGETITDYNLADNSVTTPKIANEGITHVKIADNAVWTNNIVASAITADKLAEGIINTATIVDLSVTTEKLADEAVTTEKVFDEAVTHPKIADDAVWTNNILSGSVINEKLADNSVDTRNVINLSLTNEKLADESVSTRNIIDKSVTNEKIDVSAVTTDNIYDHDVTRVKLAQEIDDFLLTQQMKDYLNEQLYDQLKDEAQSKFVGTTTSGGTTTFIYGETKESNAKKTVSVTLKFDGTTVMAESTPTDWVVNGNKYEYYLSVEGPTGVVSTTFTHRQSSGKYAGVPVTYNSTAGSVQWKYPVYHGFLTGNTTDLITKANVSTLNYSTTSVNLQGTTLTNNLSNDAYYCILTRGNASMTQLGFNILSPNSPQSAPNFVSTKATDILMTGYKVYFTNESAEPGGSFSNVTLNITQ